MPMRPEPPTVAKIPTGPPADPAVTPADPYVAPVRETLAAARNRAADRRGRWAAPAAPPAPAPARPAPNVAVLGRGRVLKGRTGGRSEPRSAGDIRRLARGGWPMCCGQVMPPVLEPAAEPCSVEDSDDLPWADRRV